MSIELYEVAAKALELIPTGQARKIREQVLAQIQAERQSHEAEHAFQHRAIQVVRMLATGLTIKEVARKLQISPATVKTYVSDMHKRLGVHNRAQLIQAARARGLVL